MRVTACSAPSSAKRQTMKSLVAALAPLLLCAPVLGAPFTPRSDAEVVEKLPSASDPALRSVAAMRKQLAARPDDTALRIDIAQRYFDLAMAQGDPRYVGYATSTIAPL